MKKSVNFVTLAIFAPVLILAGVAGFLIPAQQSLTSGAFGKGQATADTVFCGLASMTDEN